MSEPRQQAFTQWVLLLDTCGEGASVALARCAGERTEVVGEVALQERAASRELMGAVRAVLQGSGLATSDLTMVGVVAGPGSFTGVRVGMACAKGLCEACGLPLVTVSRLAVLANAAALQHGLAILQAGRGQVYVRRQAGEGESSEFLQEIEGVCAGADGGQVIFAEASLRADLGECAGGRFVALSAAAALPLVLRQRQEGVLPDAPLADANYVRDEAAIYRRQSERSRP